MDKVFTYVILVSVLKKVLMVWFPGNNVREPRAKFRVLIVTGNLTLFETEACIDPKGLIVEIPSDGLMVVVRMHIGK